MLKRIIIAGAGGQGIMFTGKLLAQAALLEGKYVSLLPCYGPEMRGGTANCTVSVSTDPISSPCAEQADIVLAMNGPSFNKFLKRAKKGGLLLANSSLVKRNPKIKSPKIIYKPFTDLAANLNNVKIANMFALGCLSKLSGIVQPKNISAALHYLVKDESDFGLNRLALTKGARLATKK